MAAVNAPCAPLGKANVGFRKSLSVPPQRSDDRNSSTCRHNQVRRAQRKGVHRHTNRSSLRADHAAIHQVLDRASLIAKRRQDLHGVLTYLRRNRRPLLRNAIHVYWLIVSSFAINRKRKQHVPGLADQPAIP